MSMLDPVVALGPSASPTETIRLGKAICILPRRDPIHTAENKATLHQPAMVVSCSAQRRLDSPGENNHAFPRPSALPEPGKGSKPCARFGKRRSRESQAILQAYTALDVSEARADTHPGTLPRRQRPKHPEAIRRSRMLDADACPSFGSTHSGCDYTTCFTSRIGRAIATPRERKAGREPDIRCDCRLSMTAPYPAHRQSNSRFSVATSSPNASCILVKRICSIP